MMTPITRGALLQRGGGRPRLYLVIAHNISSYGVAPAASRSLFSGDQQACSNQIPVRCPTHWELERVYNPLLRPSSRASIFIANMSTPATQRFLSLCDWYYRRLERGQRYGRAFCDDHKTDGHYTPASTRHAAFSCEQTQWSTSNVSGSNVSLFTVTPTCPTKLAPAVVENLHLVACFQISGRGTFGGCW